MHISFSPMRRDDRLAVVKAGDLLTLNGEAFDFTGLPDGGTIPRGHIPSEWIAGSVDRIENELHVTLILPHGPNPSPAIAFPEPIAVTADGPIPLPTDIAEEPADVDA